MAIQHYYSAGNTRNTSLSKHTTQITLSFIALHCESLIVQVHGMKERLTQWVAQTS